MDIRSPKILFQDDHLVVTHKPAGYTVYEEGGSEDAQAMAEWLQKRVGRVTPVHRIDKTTCGLLLFGRTQKSAELLQQAFFRRRVQKEYLAWVQGIVSESLKITTPLKHPKTKKVESAETLAKPISKGKNATLMRIQPKTGRFHQIRRHLSQAGYPLVGDKNYGATPVDGINRPLLSAVSLAFQHPVTLKKLSFQSRPDPDFQRFTKLQGVDFENANESTAK